MLDDGGQAVEVGVHSGVNDAGENQKRLKPGVDLRGVVCYRAVAHITFEIHDG